MSWFMVISGTAPTLPKTVGARLVGIKDAQDHVRAVAVLRGLAPAQSWLVDDSSGTTDDMRVRSRDAMLDGVPFETTELGQLLHACARTANAVLVWDGGVEAAGGGSTYDRWRDFRDAIREELSAPDWRADTHYFPGATIRP